MENLENQLQSGFTYSRLLWLILALAIVAGVVFVAFVRPRQFSEGMVAQNGSNIVILQRALDQLREDSGGSLEAVMVWPAEADGRVGVAIGSGAGEVNLCRVLVPMYLVAMPVRVDAAGGASGTGAHFTSCDDYQTGYVLSRDATGELVVK